MKFLQRPSVIVSLVMMVLMVVLLVTSLGYSLQARVAPLGVSVAGIILILASLAGEMFPSIGSRLNAGYFSTLKIQSASKEAPTQSRKGLVIIIGWALLFLCLVVVFGFLIGTAVSVFIYLKWCGNVSWFKSLAVGIASCAFIWFALVVGMQLHLFPGIVFGGLII